VKIFCFLFSPLCPWSLEKILACSRYSENILTDGWIGGWPGGWMDGWMDGWDDGWMDEWMNEWMDWWMG
jgi:hypothetical protein